MCWKTTMNMYANMGLPYIVNQYLKSKGVTDAGCFDINKGSHNLTFYANPVMMDTVLLEENHETSTHKLYFMKLDYPSKYSCNCEKKK